MDAEIEKLIDGLPDRDGASRFLASLAEKHPRDYSKLEKNPALLSDVTTLAAFSPLLAATLLQNPEYLWWLNRKRRESGVRAKEELMESLARFSLTHSHLDPQIIFARFRRRELLRIYLRDIRRLATIAEITDDISNLADAILESALKLARTEMDNRFGAPQETDEKGRARPALVMIAALGKLGSRELNYSSDIDLIFLYSGEGETSAGGMRGSVTNREYFVKLAEYVVRLVGEPSGEGAAYRVDLRLRPHGSLGALAISVDDAVRYHQNEARGWERQAMIRSRGCAGDIYLFKQFFARIEHLVFSKDETIESALANVRRSKEKIDKENVNRRGFNVKLGPGGIREIEFIAQALQLAHGGHDAWLRAPHTLISLSRLADRGHVSAAELSGVASAYEFLRRTEHVLQMENGLQTHTVPEEPQKRATLARRMTFAAGGDFELDLKRHANNVSHTYLRIFGSKSEPPALAGGTTTGDSAASVDLEAPLVPPAYAVGSDLITTISPHFGAMLEANPQMATTTAFVNTAFGEPDYKTEMMATVRFGVPPSGGSSTEARPPEGGNQNLDFRHRLAALRRTWQSLLLGIAVADIYGQITIDKAKHLQTMLAEASIAAALEIAKDKLRVRTGSSSDRVDRDEMKNPVTTVPGSDIAVLALGKLGGRGLDYGSDLDLIMVYDETQPIPAGTTPAEFYARAVELFVTVLSSVTRDGNLYRVDLRLRPYGSKGLSAMPATAFLEYMRETAVVWEMLAFVKLRAVGGDMNLGQHVENETRRIIHERASIVDPHELRDETRRVRLAIEQKRGRTRRGKEIDIKYGPGGMLDVYFAMRFLQLRDNVPDDDTNRSTSFMLERLGANGSLNGPNLKDLLAGYEFLSALDHNLRLTVGRTTRIPLANEVALKTISARMKLASSAAMLEDLTLHRIAIRSAFDRIVGERT